MRAAALLLSSLAPAAALPGDTELLGQIREFESGAALPCTAKECTKPKKKYERVMQTPAGSQWGGHGGYCGSWAIQRATLAKGAWVSQQQVRNHTVAGGGHDEEILETNIDLALKNLKLKAEGFDYKNLPSPQADAYRKWIKKQLAAGNAIAWMIMLGSASRPPKYPVYPGLPYGQYSHIEPVVGILSDHPLNDTEWYDDDYIVHYTDADQHAYYRSMKSLPDDVTMKGNCAHQDYRGMPCIYEQYGFGWAIQGFQDDKEGVPLSLDIDPSKSEPDTRDGKAPVPLTGTVTIDGLVKGGKYALHRWDSVATAFDYKDSSDAHSVHSFTADAGKLVYKDPKTFSSGGATYYRCIADN